MLGLPPEQFSQAFPFHFVLGRDLRLRQMGPLLAKVCPGIRENDTFDAHFSVQRPKVQASFAALSQRLNEIFVIRSLSTEAVLRGQVLTLAAHDALAFLVLPVVSELADLSPHGLSLADFPVHTQTSDHVLMLQSVRATSSDLEAQRERLDRAYRLLETQHLVTEALSGGESVRDTLPIVLRVIGVCMGWHVGFFWQLDLDGEHLRCEHTWQSVEGRYDAFLKNRNSVQLQRGEGIPGRVLETGEPEWGERRHADSPTKLAVQAADIELGVAFPIVAGGSTTAVMEFFSGAQREIDDHVKQAMADAGRKIGRFVETASVHEALAVTEARRAAILNAALDAVISIDETGRIVEFNAAAERIFGYSRADVIGREMAELIVPPEFREAHRRGLKRLLETGVSKVLDQRLELSAVRANGEQFPVELAITQASAGSPLFVGHLRDITEQKQTEDARLRAEDALRQSEQRYRLLVESATDGIYRISPKGRFTYANRTASAILGDEHASLVGRSLRDFVLESWRDRVLAFYRDQIASRSKSTYLEFPARSFTSQVIWLGQNVSLETSEEGEVTGLHAIARDITGRKVAEEQLRVVRESEVQAGSALQQMFLHGHPPVELAGFTIGTIALPSQGIHGDFMDFVELKSGTLDVVVGDVMGKGIPAALLGAAVKSRFIRTAASMTALQGEIPSVAGIADRVHDETVGQLQEMESFVTTFYARFDRERKRAAFVDLGHGHMIHFQPGTGSARMLAGLNLPLGFVADTTYEESSVELESGDIFVIYSDGVTEAMNHEGQQFGQRRLLRLIEESSHLAPQLLAEAIRQAVFQFAGAHETKDDLTCVAVRVDQTLGREVISEGTTFDSVLSELSSIRSYVRDACERVAGSRQAEWTDQVVLATNEAASNIIRHAYDEQADQSVSVSISVDPEALTVRLTHQGRPYVAATDDAPQEVPSLDGFPEGGFGLYVIEQCVDEVQYEAEADGSKATVTLRKRRPKVSGSAWSETEVE